MRLIAKLGWSACCAGAPTLKTKSIRSIPLMNHLTLSWQEAEQMRSFVMAPSPPTTIASIRLGRDPEQCQVLFADPRISRVHAEITWQPEQQQFWIKTLRRINPILMDHLPLVDRAQLQDGTLLELGETSIRVAIATRPSLSRSSLPNASSPSIADSLSAHYSRSNHSQSITFSQFIPLAVSQKELRQPRYFLPGVATVIWVVLLFSTLGQPNLFNSLLALYIGGAAFYFIYCICGKSKPWWVIGTAAIATPILLLTPVWSAIAFLFRNILPGQLPETNSNVITLFIAFWFGAGLPEELLKALPVLGLQWYGHYLAPPWRQRVGVTEPLDGIILGAASGLGFTLIETLGQYVPNLVNILANQAGQSTGELLGLQLLIPRLVGSLFGHLAYSGCFGYYIGLSYLKPRRKWQLLGIGYLVAATLHAFWNASAGLGSLALGLAGILAYCLLTGAILKARQFSQRT